MIKEFIFSYSFIHLFFVYECFGCMYVLQKSDEGIALPGTRVTEGRKLACEC